MTEQTSRLAIVLDSTGAQRNAEGLAGALQKMTQAGEQAEKATEDLGGATKDLNSWMKAGATESGKVTQSTNEQREAFKKLRDQIDPVGAAIDKVGQKYSELKGYFDRGIIDKEEFRTLSDRLNSTTDELTGVAKAERDAAKASDDQKASLQRLAVQLDPVSAAFKKLADQQKELDSAKASGMLSSARYDELSASLANTRKQLEITQDAMKKTGVTSRAMAYQMRMIPAQMTDIVVSLASGQAPITVLLQQGGQLKDMFGGIGPAIKGVGGYVAGLINPFTLAAAAVGVLGLAYYKGSQEQDEFYKSLTLTGNLVGKTSGQLADMAARVSVAANSTTGAAASTLNQLVSSGKVAGDSLERVTTAIVKTSEATGIATDKLVGDFNDIAADPVAAITKLNDQYHFLTLATYNQIKALQDEGNQQEAARVASESYSSTMIQRSNDIKANLGLLEGAWDLLGKAAKGAWDAMLDVGREGTVQQKIADTQRQIDEIEKNTRPGVFGMGGIGDDGAQKQRLALLKQQLSALNSEAMAQDVLNDSISTFNKRQQDGIKAQTYINTLTDQTLTNAQKRTKEQDKLTKALEKTRAAGISISAEEEAKLRANINDKYKDPKTPKTPKSKAYTEDAATRLLDQLNRQTAAMQSQLDASDKLNSATQARVKFERQIADLKSKSQLTADQKSLLSRSEEILQAYKQQEALQNQVKTLDDYRKMQDQVKAKDELQNDLLRERLALLEKAKATGKLAPGEYEQTRANIYKNTPAELPSSVKSVVGNMSPTGGQLSGTFGGMQQQYMQLDQAQQQLQTWLQAQESAYAQAAQITTEGEARMTAIRQQAAQTNQVIESQKNEIITSATQTMIDSGLQILATGFGEQSGIYKAAFAASKAFAIAQSLVSIQQGIAMAAANPFPYNIAAMASVAAATASIVSNLSAIAGTGFASGGFTGQGGKYQPAGMVHKGEYVFDQAATNRIGVSNLEALRNGGSLDATLSKPGFGTGAQNVNNNSNSTVFSPQIQQDFHIQQGVTPEQMNLSLAQTQKQATSDALDQVANQIVKGNGKVGNAMRGMYTGRRTT
ncbi:phage tail length tape measure family protein [Citrobacter braakii]|uniref:phage tail length tape measure family protein n=1 Tax=Citrobacter braakii TaxID=57706 RepID=UPI000543204D|nr:phage tail length tape measure family protein [Citrobacter braakii]KHE06423.1 tail protein [Citrobacter braakii]